MFFFHLALLISWPKAISKKDLLIQCELECIGTIIIRQWRWIGYVIWRERDTVSKTALHWKPKGNSKRDRSKIPWRDSQKLARDIHSDVEILYCCPVCQWACRAVSELLGEWVSFHLRQKLVLGFLQFKDNFVHIAKTSQNAMTRLV